MRDGSRSAVSLALTKALKAASAALLRGSAGGAVLGADDDVPGDETGDEVGAVDVTDLVVDGLLAGSPPLDEVHPATAAITTSRVSATAAVLRVTGTPTTGLQGSASDDPESQCVQFARTDARFTVGYLPVSRRRTRQPPPGEHRHRRFANFRVRLYRQLRLAPVDSETSQRSRCSPCLPAPRA